MCASLTQETPGSEVSFSFFKDAFCRTASREKSLRCVASSSATNSNGVTSCVTRESSFAGMSVIRDDAAICCALFGSDVTSSRKRTPERPAVAVVGNGSGLKSHGVIFVPRRRVFKLSSAAASATACAAFDASFLERTRARAACSAARTTACATAVSRASLASDELYSFRAAAADAAADASAAAFVAASIATLRALCCSPLRAYWPSFTDIDVSLLCAITESRVASLDSAAAKNAFR